MCLFVSACVPPALSLPLSLRRFMAWNGHFASLLFINHWEYTRNASFARDVTLPLLSGLNDWWACYLNKSVTGPDSHVYNDNNAFNPDYEHEGQKVRRHARVLTATHADTRAHSTHTHAHSTHTLHTRARTHPVQTHALYTHTHTHTHAHTHLPTIPTLTAHSVRSLTHARAHPCPCTHASHRH